jgi:hypothetical protein
MGDGEAKGRRNDTGSKLGRVDEEVREKKDGRESGRGKWKRRAADGEGGAGCCIDDVCHLNGGCSAGCALRAVLCRL